LLGASIDPENIGWLNELHDRALQKQSCNRLASLDSYVSLTTLWGEYYPNTLVGTDKTMKISHNG
jgi:hypothetical protein